MITKPRGTLTFSKKVGMASGDDVSATIRRLRTDRAFTIRATVGNNPTAVRERYRQRTGQTLSVGALTNALVTMASIKGKSKELDSIIRVPWIAGANDELDRAFSYLHGEAQVRIADPNVQAALRNQPTTGLPGDVDSTTGTVDGGGDASDDDSGGNFWDDLLDSLPGVLDVVTGIAGGTAGDAADEAARIAAEREAAKRRNTMIIVGISIVLFIGLVIIIVRSTRG